MTAPSSAVFVARLEMLRLRTLCIFEAIASALEQHWMFVLSLLATLYLWIVVRGSGAKFVWHDELFTFYIASAPTFRQMMQEIFTIDLNPPLLYLFTRVSIRLLPYRDLALRLPSIIGFFVAWLMLFLYARRRFSTTWAVFAVLLFWSTSAIFYAWEARPYALLLGLVSALLWCWSITIDGPQVSSTHPIWVVPCLLFLGVALFSTHMLAIFIFLPFLLAQAVRSVRTQHIDVPVIVALLAPLAVCFLFLHLTSRIGSYIYPASSLAGLGGVATFYLSYGNSVGTALLAFFFVSLLLPAAYRKFAFSTVLLEEIVLWIGLALVPIGVILALMVKHVSMGERYLVVGAFGLSLCIVALLFHSFSKSSGVGALGCIVFLLFLPIALHRNARVEGHKLKAGYTPLSTTLSLLEGGAQGLPIVVAHGDTVIDLNDRENAAFASRVYFLLSRPDALRYTHFTLYEEELRDVDGVFPLHDHIESYSSFVALHPHFLLVGTAPSDPSDSLEWILPKLIDQGASVRLLARTSSSYIDSLIYEVSMPPKV